MEENVNKIAGIFIGISFGILMSLILILMLKTTGYTMETGSFFVLFVIALFLPHCITFTRKYTKKTVMLKMIMTVTSFLIFVLYANAVSKDSYTLHHLVMSGVVLHAGAFAGIIVLKLFKNRKEGRE